MKKKFSVSINKKIEKFNKKIIIPGDKSCSIRALLLASQCIGVSKIKNLWRMNSLIMAKKKNPFQIQEYFINEIGTEFLEKAYNDVKIKLDIDPKSHSAWTGGKQKILDKGRVSKFNKKFQNFKTFLK